MQFLVKYKTVIAIAVIIIILVVVRTFSTGHFKNDAKKLARPSFNHSVIISKEQISTIAGNILIVNLNEDKKLMKDLPEGVVNIPADSVLNRENFKIISGHKGPVLLLSSDPAVSSRIWMVLSQMGRRDIFILTDNPDNEVFKNKFRPDTLIRPEI